MRVMAIDYGDAHTGVAVSDLTGLLAGYTDTIQAEELQHGQEQEERPGSAGDEEVLPVLPEAHCSL